jgi:6-pyruvoyltetrahydropterin/6-carboxytetrahydropterin synthase
MGSSYTVVVAGEFNAMHRVRLPDGSYEPQHGHDWQVRVHFAAESLDDRGMVVDFVEASEALTATLGQLQHQDLNQLPAFQSSDPTAELVARWIFDALTERQLPALSAVAVREAPGCVAIYQVDPTARCRTGALIDDGILET